MTIATEPDAGAAMRCAEWTARAGVRPTGSASVSRLFVLVEWPLPWPRDVSEIDALAPLHAAVAQRKGRVQCIAPVSTAAGGDGLREVAVLRGDGAGGPYVEQSTRVPLADLADVALALLDDPSRNAVVRPGRRVLVCAHGRRDRCCGSMGTTLARELAAVELSDVTVWRCSHLGGHRFAPTALVLPEATQWGLLDADALRSISLRSGDPRKASAHYRGYSGFTHGAASVLDGYALAERGWEWLDQPRQATQTDGGWWRLERPDGSAYEGSVSVRRRVPVPACGEPIEAALKSEDEFALDWAAPAATIGSAV